MLWMTSLCQKNKMQIYSFSLPYIAMLQSVEFLFSSNFTSLSIHPPNLTWLNSIHTLNITLVILSSAWTMNEMSFNMLHGTLQSCILAMIMLSCNYLDFVSFCFYSTNYKIFSNFVYLLVFQVIVQCPTQRSHAITLY